MNKKNIFFRLFFIFIIFTSCNNYIDKYFNNEPYQTSRFDMEQNVLYLSYISSTDINLITKGIVYFKENKEIKPFFFIDEYLIRDVNDNQISFPIETQEFYGWKINLINKSSLYFQIYTEKGCRTTDPLIFDWDKKNKNFKKVMINSENL